MRVATAVVAAVILAAASVLMASSALAQTPDEGVVRGKVTMVSAGTVLEGAVEVELIVLEASQVTSTVKAPVTNGTYEARVPATGARTYVPRLTYQRVEYFGDPVRFTATEKAATRDFAIYATTDRADVVSLIQTIVTVVGLDRAKGEMGVLREDVVSVTGDRVYTGGASGVTLRLPAPEGTTDASDEDSRGTFANGVLALTTPIRPGEASSIITSYLVKYDPAQDRYRLRVTVPIPAQSVVARVPREFARKVRPVAPAEQVDDQVLRDDARTVLYIVRTPSRIEAGQSLLVDIDGVAGALQHHPLTEQPGVSIAAGAVLASVAAAGVFLWRRRPLAA
ncbi:MAG: hypothetical protein EPO65_03730 [Dehalococcoidia bacterium]|nr:MAG: hypothetical protein EPO65_03730 [Dehalococcoidia bacterium]